MLTTNKAGVHGGAAGWRAAFERKALALWALFLVSVVTHFIFFDLPLQVVFDEVYFPKYGLAYLKHEYYFDLHPPLGKLIYGLAGWLAGVNPDFSFASNMLPYPDASYLALRMPARIAGVLIPLLLYGIARELGLSRWAAFVAGALAVLDNALLVSTRLALIDPFLILFGLTALWCWLYGRALAGRAAWGWLAAAGVFAGAALSVKWTGLAFVGLILLFEGLSWLVQLRKLRAPSLRGIARMALVAMLTASVYVASFALHFALAYKTGPDDAAMSPQFQATLQGNPLASNAALERPGFAGKFVELHQRMFHNTRTTLGPHAYASRWYDWPFMMRTVDFWAQHTQAADGPRYAHIYFMGNPVVWWATGYCMLFLLVNFLPKLAAWGVRARTQLAEPTEVFLIVAYLANMLPFVGIARIMFAYHYLPALCIALLGLGLLLDRTGVYKVRIGVALLVVALASFVYFAPLSYGLPLAPADFDARFWVKTWR